MFPRKERFELGTQEAVILVFFDGEHRVCVEDAVVELGAVEFGADVVDFVVELRVGDMDFFGVEADDWARGWGSVQVRFRGDSMADISTDRISGDP